MRKNFGDGDRFDHCVIFKGAPGLTDLGQMRARQIAECKVRAEQLRKFARLVLVARCRSKFIALKFAVIPRLRSDDNNLISHERAPQTLSLRSVRAEVAALLGMNAGHFTPPIRARKTSMASKPKFYVLDMFPYPSGAGPARRASRRLHRDRHCGALQTHARAATSFIRWAGTHSACRRNNMQSSRVNIRQSPRARTSPSLRHS